MKQFKELDDKTLIMTQGGSIWDILAKSLVVSFPVVPIGINQLVNKK